MHLPITGLELLLLVGLRVFRKVGDLVAACACTATIIRASGVTMTTQRFPLKGEFIELNVLLKLLALAPSGGAAKA
jgi:hypothetical protein